MSETFQDWVEQPVPEGCDPAPWIDGFAIEAARQAWDHQATKIATLQRDLAQASAEAKVNGDDAADLRRELGEAHLRIGGLKSENERLRKELELVNK